MSSQIRSSKTHPLNIFWCVGPLVSGFSNIFLLIFFLSFLWLFPIFFKLTLTKFLRNAPCVQEPLRQMPKPWPLLSCERRPLTLRVHSPSKSSSCSAPLQHLSCFDEVLLAVRDLSAPRCCSSTRCNEIMGIHGWIPRRSSA